MFSWLPFGQCHFSASATLVSLTGNLRHMCTKPTSHREGHWQVLATWWTAVYVSAPGFQVVKKGVKVQQPSWIFPTTFLLPFKHAWPAVGCNIHSDTRALTISSESCWTKAVGSQTEVSNFKQQIFSIWDIAKKQQQLIQLSSHHSHGAWLIPRFMGFRGRRFAFFPHAFGPKKFLKFLISSAPPRCIPIEVI